MYIVSRWLDGSTEEKEREKDQISITETVVTLGQLISLTKAITAAEKELETFRIVKMIKFNLPPL